MDLRQTFHALEDLKTEKYPQGITLALDLGVHQYCDINSNCPLAIQLRKYIHEAGVTLVDLLAGFAQSQEPPPDRIEPTLPEFNGKAMIQIAGQNMEIDFTDTIKQQLGSAYENQIHYFKQMQNHITDVGASLHRTYLHQIYELRRTKVLPQLSFGVTDLVKYPCCITTKRDKYIFLFPREYKPQWIVTGGVRYLLNKDDIDSLERPCYIQFAVTVDGKIFSARLLGDRGYGMEHYHGHERDDCWGNVAIPERWNKSLSMLNTLANQLMASLATINKDSLVQHDIEDMIHIDNLMERATELGEEGHVEARERPTGGWRTGDGEDPDRTTEPPTDAPAPAGRRWGHREDTTPRDAAGHIVILDELANHTDANPAIQLTDDQEYLRRWGVTSAVNITIVNRVCALCGHDYVEHGGFHCQHDELTTRTPEQELMRRFGVTEPPRNMDIICMVCGERFGRHHRTGNDNYFTICPRDWRDR